MDKTAKTSNIKAYLKSGFILFAITVSVALILSVVYTVTIGPIEEALLQKKKEAIEIVMPGALISGADVVFDDATVSPVDVDGAVAYCVEVAPNGFAGPVKLIVGVKHDGQKLRVTGVSIIEMSETPDIGTKADDPGFLGQFGGLAFGVVTGGGENSVEAISGATVTSRAVIAGVNLALEAAERVYNGEGAN